MVENIYCDNILIAQKYNLNHINENIFPTPEDVTFQFGVGISKNKKTFMPHIHKRAKRSIDTTSEFLFVLEGQMKIDLYSEKEKFVKQIILKNNECLLQFIGGHSIELEEGSKYFEIKQGPYMGRDFDKYNLDIGKDNE